MVDNSEIVALSEEIKNSRKILSCLGDETRQHIILEMIKGGDCTGLRVNDIAVKSNLSRPAVSHHLGIMKDAGLVKVRREGTKNYYYFDADMESFTTLITMLNHAKAIMSSLPERSGDD